MLLRTGLRLLYLCQRTLPFILSLFIDLFLVNSVFELPSSSYRFLNCYGTEEIKNKNHLQYIGANIFNIQRVMQEKKVFTNNRRNEIQVQFPTEQKQSTIRIFNLTHKFQLKITDALSISLLWEKLNSFKNNLCC